MFKNLMHKNGGYRMVNPTHAEGGIYHNPRLKLYKLQSKK